MTLKISEKLQIFEKVPKNSDEMAEEKCFFVTFPKPLSPRKGTEGYTFPET
jgi:hypothetical protein